MAHARNEVAQQCIVFFLGGCEKSATCITGVLSPTRIGDWRPLLSRGIAPTYPASNVRDHSVQQEDVMRFGMTAFAAATLCVALTGTALAQDSGEPATSIGCLHMQKKVSAALDANQSSANYGAARTQAQGAQGFCAHGMYKQGVDGYAAALQMLGAS
jgi:hypothetical protein